MEACLFLGMVLIGVLTSLYLLVVTAMMMTMFESHPPHQTPLRNPANDISYSNTKNAVPQHEHQQNKNAAHPRITSRQMELLSTMQQGCVATADVVGNLGPPSTVLADADDNTDWLKHRWQTASNMHGTAIPGTHWLRLTWPHVVELHSVVLHWETAFDDSPRSTTSHCPDDQIWTFPGCAGHCPGCTVARDSNLVRFSAGSTTYDHVTANLDGPSGRAQGLGIVTVGSASVW